MTKKIVTLESSRATDAEWLATPEGRAAEREYNALIDQERRAYLRRVAYREPHDPPVVRVVIPRTCSREPRRAVSKASPATAKDGPPEPPPPIARARVARLVGRILAAIHGPVPR